MFIPAATYGIRMLLLPYRARIEWVPVEDLAAGDIYYGSKPELARQIYLSICVLTQSSLLMRVVLRCVFLAMWRLNS